MKIDRAMLMLLAFFVMPGCAHGAERACRVNRSLATELKLEVADWQAISVQSLVDKWSAGSEQPMWISDAKVADCEGTVVATNIGLVSDNECLCCEVFLFEWHPGPEGCQSQLSSITLVETRADLESAQALATKWYGTFAGESDGLPDEEWPHNSARAVGENQIQSTSVSVKRDGDFWKVTLEVFMTSTAE